jgi:hypothetical protein
VVTEVRTCIDCLEAKSLDQFLPIKSRPGQYYSRCRQCRNRCARERYHSTPEIRAAEIARASKNQLRRRAQG